MYFYVGIYVIFHLSRGKTKSNCKRDGCAFDSQSKNVFIKDCTFPYIGKQSSALSSATHHVMANKNLALLYLGRSEHSTTFWLNYNFIICMTYNHYA